MTRALVVQHDRAVKEEELGSLRALGCEVVLCGGPDRGACPVLADRPCPLAEHADVLVYDVRSLRYGDGTHALIDELRALYADKPLLVVGERSDDGLDPRQAGSLIWLRGGASVGRMDLAIEEALGDR